MRRAARPDRPLLPAPQRLRELTARALLPSASSRTAAARPAGDHRPADRRVERHVPVPSSRPTRDAAERGRVYKPIARRAAARRLSDGTLASREAAAFLLSEADRLGSGAADGPARRPVWAGHGPAMDRARPRDGRPGDDRQRPTSDFARCASSMRWPTTPTARAVTCCRPRRPCLRRRPWHLLRGRTQAAHGAVGVARPQAPPRTSWLSCAWSATALTGTWVASLAELLSRRRGSRRRRDEPNAAPDAADSRSPIRPAGPPLAAVLGPARRCR